MEYNWNVGYANGKHVITNFYSLWFLKMCFLLLQPNSWDPTQAAK